MEVLVQKIEYIDMVFEVYPVYSYSGVPIPYIVCKCAVVPGLSQNALMSICMTL